MTRISTDCVENNLHSEQLDRNFGICDTPFLDICVMKQFIKKMRFGKI